MNIRVTILTAVLALASSAYAADPPRKSENDSASIGTPVARSSGEADAMRVRGSNGFAPTVAVVMLLHTSFLHE